ncbi:MAG: addiction module antidote protein [Pirellulales bacterium]
MTLTRDYNEWHLEQLRKEHVDDPTYIAGYLSACLDEGEDVFLIGLREVAQALGGISELAAHTNLDRKHLYKMLSEEGNPTFASISVVLQSLGMHLQCVPIDQSSEA